MPSANRRQTPPAPACRPRKPASATSRPSTMPLRRGSAALHLPAMKIIRREFLKTAVAAAALPPLLDPSLRLAALSPQVAAPAVKFPAAPRERIAVASYPFREFIAGTHDPHATSAKMPLKE